VFEFRVITKEMADNTGQLPNADTGGGGGGGGNAGPTPSDDTQIGSALGVHVEMAPAGTYLLRTIMKPLALFDNAPVFRFSSFPTTSRQDNIISHTALLRNAYGYWNSIEDIPMGVFLVKMKEGLDDDQIDQVVAMLESCIQGDWGSSVWDYRDEVGAVAKATSILSLFFIFTTAVAMLIASFSLMSSMYTNVYEQAKEIGILRAIGISTWWMRRIYVYEAFVLVLASSLLGVLIGSLVGYTLLLQRILFTQLPIPFKFPWQIMVVVSACSLVFAFVSSLGPINRVMQKPIVTLMRDT